MKTVLVTGANRGLGLELVRQYAADGWQVLAASRSGGEALRALAGDSGPGRIRPLPLDVEDPGAIAALAASLGDQPIHVLINNAGYFGPVGFSPEGMAAQRFGATDYAQWERTLRINLLAPMRLAEAFIGHLERSGSGRLITLTSVVGSMALNTGGGMYSYRTSKAAVNMLMRSLAIDLAPRGVLAVGIHPGWVRTDMGGPGADLDAATSVAGMRQVIAGLTPDKLGRIYAWDGTELPY